MTTETSNRIADRLGLAYGADRVAVLDGGQLVQEDTPRALEQQSGTFRRLVAAYEGDAW